MNRARRTTLSLLLCGLFFTLAACTGGESSSPQEQLQDSRPSSTTGPTAVPATTASTANTASPDGPTGDGDNNPGPADTDGVVTVVGAAPIEEAADIAEALASFAAAKGISVEFVAIDDNERAEIERRQRSDPAAGNDVDIALIRSRRDVTDLASAGQLVAIPDAVRSSWPPAFDDLNVVNGARYSLSTTVAVQSLVWYRPDLFADREYEVPTSWDDLDDLTRLMIENGDTPFCLGADGSSVTGEVFHDWVEDLSIRFLGPTFVDSWINHDVAFDQPEIKEVWAEVIEFWSRPQMVRDSIGSIDSSAGAASALASGDCFMNKRSISPLASLEPGELDGSELSVFYLPSVKGDRPVTVKETSVVAFADSPAIWSVVEFLSSGDYADRRVSLEQGTDREGTFLSAAQDQTRFGLSATSTDILSILMSADAIRHDASDAMPASIDPLIIAGAEAVLQQRASIAEATQAVEVAWPR